MTGYARREGCNPHKENTMNKKYITMKRRSISNEPQLNFSIDRLAEFLNCQEEAPPEFTPDPVTLSYPVMKTFDYMPIMNGLAKFVQIVRVTQAYLMDKPRDSYYTFFQIPKATGGFRDIAAPNAELGTQFTQIKNCLEYDLHALTHDAAFAYVKGRSTVHAMQRHQANESMYFLKLDVKDFFGSFTKEAIVIQLRKIYPFTGLSPATLSDLADIATLRGGLPQGTQLSPILTNLLMIPFDDILTKRMTKNGFIYTRYADDLLISHKQPFKFNDVINTVEYIFEKEEYPFRLKREKTRYGTRKGRNWNLGLMLNKDNQITLGHEYKNRIKVILHKLNEGDVPTDRTRGMISYLKMVEPVYYAALDSYVKTKYHQSIAELTQVQ